MDFYDNQNVYKLILEILGFYFGRVFFNFIGAVIRWCYGSIWRTIFRKKKFSFKEYLYGPKESNYYDDMGHLLNNRIIGAIGFVFMIIPLIKLIFN